MAEKGEKKEKKRQFWPKFLIGLYVVIFFSFAYFFLNSAWVKSGEVNYLSLVDDFVLTPADKIEQTNGRTNILLMGKGGQGHSAPDLTDTMIVFSVSQQKGGISSISFSRDIWIPEIRAKINSAYYWGNQQSLPVGLSLAKETVGKVFGIPIHYAVVLDFSSFKDIVDVLGRINVNVEKSFTDEKFPIAGRENDPCSGDKEFKCRYETIHFEKGVQPMDGLTALKFVRSRMATGDEGTDFAREERQQAVIAAIKEKILSAGTLLNPVKLWRLEKVTTENLETDISLNAAAILARKILDNRWKISASVLPENLLYHPQISARYDFQYVFIPKEGNWSSVQEWIKSVVP